MDNKNIIKKIKGLLAISKDQKNDEESQSAFVLAQKMMIRYNIEKHEVEDVNLDDDAGMIGEESVTIYKRLYWWERQLAGIISKNFKVKNFLTSKRIGKQQKRKIVFYGFGRDLELAKEMYILAYDVIVFHSGNFIEQYYETNVGVTRTRYFTESIKSSYIRGFVVGLSQRFEEQVSELRQVYEVLVLVPKAVEEAYEEYSSDWGKVLSLEAPPVEVEEAYHNGYKTATEIDFTKSSLSDTI